MDGLAFEWDEKKKIINIKKHGISFEEAMTVFYDDDAIVFDDPDHSIEECRFLIIGMSGKEGIDYEKRIRYRKAESPKESLFKEA
ncbi:MAG: BrnT family toxin [Lachnospiraceae bacterium]|nr:BrnT family toxin [Lachnospiraceae bacterium]